jgi:hypothetical protein
MTEYRRTKPRNFSERLYRILLFAYPRSFRDEFGDAMIEFHRDRLAHAHREAGLPATARVWAQVAIDLLRNALPARVESVRRPIRKHADERAARRDTPSAMHARKDQLMVRSVIQDIRFAFRGMRRTPAFTATVLATLALGIGGSVATFSAVNSVLLRPLPFRDPSRLARLQQMAPYQTVSEPEFADYRRDARSFSKLAAYNDAFVIISAGGGAEPERLRVLQVTDDFFATLARPCCWDARSRPRRKSAAGPRWWSSATVYGCGASGAMRRQWASRSS